MNEKEYEKNSKIKFEDQDGVDKCLFEGFMGWDISEVFIVLTEWMKNVNDISRNIGDFVIDVDEPINDLLRKLRKEKENRTKQANEIRNLWKTGEYTEEQLSQLFNIKIDTIHTTVMNENLFDLDYEEWIKKYGKEK